MKSTKQQYCNRLARRLIAVFCVSLATCASFESVHASTWTADDEKPAEPTATPAPPAANPDAAAPAPAPAIANSADPKPVQSLTEDDPELGWWRRLTIRGGYGMIMVEQPYAKAFSMYGAFGYRSRSWLESGFAYRKNQAAYDEKVKFPATGYSETRSYQLESMELTPYLLLRMSRAFSLQLAAGLSSTTSKLDTVTTDAPVPASLAPGFTREASWCPAYHASLIYEYLLGPLGLGLEVGYGSSSSNPDGNLKGLFAGAVLTLRPGASTSNPEPKATPAPEAQSSPTPAPAAPPASKGD